MKITLFFGLFLQAAIGKPTAVKEEEAVLHRVGRSFTHYHEREFWRHMMSEIYDQYRAGEFDHMARDNPRFSLQDFRDIFNEEVSIFNEDLITFAHWIKDSDPQYNRRIAENVMMSFVQVVLKRLDDDDEVFTVR